MEDARSGDAGLMHHQADYKQHIQHVPRAGISPSEAETGAHQRLAPYEQRMAHYKQQVSAASGYCTCVCGGGMDSCADRHALTWQPEGVQFSAGLCGKYCRWLSSTGGHPARCDGST
jgi:hypothetical protein